MFWVILPDRRRCKFGCQGTGARVPMVPVLEDRRRSKFKVQPFKEKESLGDFDFRELRKAEWAHLRSGHNQEISWQTTFNLTELDRERVYVGVARDLGLRFLSLRDSSLAHNFVEQRFVN